MCACAHMYIGCMDGYECTGGRNIYISFFSYFEGGFIFQLTIEKRSNTAYPKHMTVSQDQTQNQDQNEDLLQDQDQDQNQDQSEDQDQINDQDQNQDQDLHGQLVSKLKVFFSSVIQKISSFIKRM